MSFINNLFKKGQKKKDPSEKDIYAEMYELYLEAHAKARSGYMLADVYSHIPETDRIRKSVLLLAGLHQHGQPSNRESFENSLKGLMNALDKKTNEE